MCAHTYACSHKEVRTTFVRQFYHSIVCVPETELRVLAWQQVPLPTEPSLHHITSEIIKSIFEGLYMEFLRKCIYLQRKMVEFLRAPLVTGTDYQSSRNYKARFN